MKNLSGPHIWIKNNAPKIYLEVITALLPCCVAAIYCYGLRALILLLWGPLLHVFSDYIFARFVRREQAYLDLSGGISGIILVLLLPPTVSIWAVSAGILFSSVIVKQFFGGVGCNLFNPAFAGRAFLAVAFTTTSEIYVQPFSDLLRLDTLLTGPATLYSAPYRTSGWLEILSGFYPGPMGLTGAVLAAMGAAYLLARGVLRFHAPLAYFATIIAGYWLVFFENASLNSFMTLFATSGIVFCGAFALGDFSTIPSSGSGKIAFGIGTGILFLIFYASGYSILAIVSPVLIMNAVTPLLEFYIRPRVFSKDAWYSQKSISDFSKKEETEVHA